MADDTRKLIFQLEINNSKLGVELATITDRLKNAKDNQAAWNKELVGLKEGTAEYAKAAKNAAEFGDKVRSLSQDAKAVNQALKISDAVPGSYNELKASIGLTRDQLNNLKIGSEEYNKTEAKLNDLLGQEIEIRKNQKSLFQERIKDALNESEVTGTLQQQYNALVLQLEGLEVGSDQFNKLAKEAGALKDRIGDVKTATKDLATGSGLQQFGNVLGGIKGDLTDLNFEDAAGKAKQLADISKSITFSGAVQGIKDFGSTLLNTGKALLSNPIFLIGAAISAIIFAIKEWSDAEEANRVAVTKANRDKLDSLKEYGDFEEKLAKAHGLTANEQTKIHLQKLQEQLDATAAEYNRLQSVEKLTDEEVALYKKAGEDIIKLRQDRTLTIAQAETDERNRLKEALIKSNEDAKALSKQFADEKAKAIEEQQKKNQERIDYFRELSNNAIKETNELEKKFAEEKEQRNQQEIDDFTKKLEATQKAQEEHNKAIEEFKKEHDALFAEIQNESAEGRIEALRNERDNDINDFSTSEEEKAAISEHFEKKITEVKNAQTAQRLQAASAAFGNLSALEDAFGTETKVGASAQALISTYLSANEAFASLAGIPLVGPALGAAAAGLAIASGIANVAKINGVQFYDGGFTTPGNPREETTNLGSRPYKYHKSEYITPHKVLSTPEGAYYVQRLEAIRTGSPNKFSGVSGFADGGFANRAATDSVNAEIASKEAISDAISQIKVVASIEEITDKATQMEIIDSRNTI